MALALFVAAAAPVRLCAQAPAAASVEHQNVRELRTRGFDLLYNLDYPEALSTFQQAITLDPTSPAPHRDAASVVWMQILFEWGAVLADDYMGEAKEMVARQRPSPAAALTFREHITRALELAEQRLEGHERDPDAHYQVGASSGFLGSYTATVEGRLLGSLGSVRRAFREQLRVLELAPSRKDAGLLPGMYRYFIADMSLPLRVAARVAGMGGDRAGGLRLVEDAAAYPSDSQTDALFISIVLYNLEHRYDDALRVIRELQRRYPRNRLLWLESGTTALRAGRAQTARSEIEHGLAMQAADPRPRAFGEEARWRLSHGTALLTLNRDEAARELRRGLAGEGAGWVRGRIHRELGRVADLDGRRSAAIEEYRLAIRLCTDGNDEACADEASRLTRTAYR